jgi:hypothetical protein
MAAKTPGDRLLLALISVVRTLIVELSEKGMMDSNEFVAKLQELAIAHKEASLTAPEVRLHLSKIKIQSPVALIAAETVETRFRIAGTDATPPPVATPAAAASTAAAIEIATFRFPIVLKRLCAKSTCTCS